MATPTNTAEPGTPPGRYEVKDEDAQSNCYDVGVTGRVRGKNDDKAVQWVTIEVKGDDDGDDVGPFTGKTDANGKYNIYLGTLEKLDGVEFEAKVIGGSNVISEDKVKWTVMDDCHAGDANQIKEIDWDYKTD